MGVKRIAIVAAQGLGLNPRRIWGRATGVRDRILDFFHNVPNRGQSALPPPSLRMVGGGDFHQTGALNVRNIKQFTTLDGKRILEIGCGSGRNALALATYDVAYDGIDVFKPFIDWCNAHITRIHPAFRFHHADIYNGRYNPKGTMRPESFRFPFPDAAYDLIVLTSVFTHMLEPEVKCYLREIGRLLAPGGQLYATFFLLDPEANRLIAEGRAGQPMKPFDGERVKVVDPRMPESAVAFDEAVVMEALEQSGLQLVAVRHGAWAGRREYFDYQDVVFAAKGPNSSSMRSSQRSAASSTMSSTCSKPSAPP